MTHVYFQLQVIYLTAYLTSSRRLLAYCYLPSLSNIPCSPHAQAASDFLQLFEDARHASAPKTIFCLPGIVFSYKSMVYFFIYFRSLFKYSLTRELFLPIPYQIWSLLPPMLYFSLKYFSLPCMYYFSFLSLFSTGF